MYMYMYVCNCTHVYETASHCGAANTEHAYMYVYLCLLIIQLLCPEHVGE